jgi:hypothetical protein
MAATGTAAPASASAFVKVEDMETLCARVKETEKEAIHSASTATSDLHSDMFCARVFLAKGTALSATGAVETTTAMPLDKSDVEVMCSMAAKVSAEKPALLKAMVARTLEGPSTVEDTCAMRAPAKADAAAAAAAAAATTTAAAASPAAAVASTISTSVAGPAAAMASGASSSTSVTKQTTLVAEAAQSEPPPTKQTSTVADAAKQKVDELIIAAKKAVLGVTTPAKKKESAAAVPASVLNTVTGGFVETAEFSTSY